MANPFATRIQDKVTELTSRRVRVLAEAQAEVAILDQRIASLGRLRTALQADALKVADVETLLSEDLQKVAALSPEEKLPPGQGRGR